MGTKRITSWERRRRRRIKITLGVTFFIILLAAAVLLFKLSLPYETWNLSEFYSINYSGFNNEGKIELVLDVSKLTEEVNKLKKDYNDSLFHFNKCTDSDYEALEQSLQANTLTGENLSNGSNVTVFYSIDKELAKKLKLNIAGESMQVTVSGLDNAIRLTKDDLFKDLIVSFSGISPNISMTVQNQSTNPFIKSIVFNPLEAKEFYASGDEITIRAFYSSLEAKNQHYSVDTPSEECLKTFTVSSDSAYISSESELPDYIVDEAAKAGLNAFTDANEYGVRIFCEANLVPVYINKQATFEWGNPSFRSAYLKCVRSEYAGSLGYHFNDLDIVYSVVITQANGVSCPCYAVVRFSNLIINSDGSIDYDFSNPKVISSDYKIDSIHKTVATSFESTHTVTKIKGR